MVDPTYHRSLFLISVAALFSAVLVFLFGLTHTTSALLALDGKTIDFLYPTSLTVALSLSLLSFYYSRFPLAKPIDVRVSSAAWIEPFKYFAALTILAQSVWLLFNTHMYFDERATGALIASKPFPELLSFILKTTHVFGTSTQHYVSILTSSALTALIGVSEIKIRLGSLFFSVLFLMGLHLFSRRHLSTFATFFLYLNMMCNHQVIYSFIIARGYSSILFSSLILFWLVLRLLRGQDGGYRSAFFYFIAVAILVLSNGNGSMFAVVLSATLCLWLLIHRDSLPKKTKRGIVVYISIAVFFAPLTLSMLFRERQLLAAATTQAVQGSIPISFGVLGALLGAEYDYLGKIAAVCFFLLVGYKVSTKRARCFEDFNFLLIAVAMGIYFCSLLFLRSNIFYVRYLIGFLVPLLCFLTRELECLPAQLRKGGVVVLFVITAVIPLAQRSAILRDYHEHLKSFDEFIASVTDRTEPIGENCYTANGREKEIAWTGIYLPSKRGEECRRKFLLLLPEDSTNRIVDRTMKELIRDPGNRVLYEISG